MIRSRTVKAGLLASGQAMSAVLSLVAAAILSRLLERHDYATYRQTFLAYNFVAPLLILGLPNALFFFLPGEKKRPLAVTLENLMMLSAMGILFALFLAFGGNVLLARRFNNPDLTHTLRLLAPYPIFILPAASFTACMMARNRVASAATYNVFSRTIACGGVVCACLYWRTPSAAVIGMVVASVATSLPAILFMLHVTREGPRRPTLSGMRKQLAYSVPLGIAGMVGAININLDKIVVSSLCSTDSFAVYVNGALEIPLIAILTGSATAVLIPEMTAMLKAGNKSECHELWKRAVTKTAIGILPVMVFLFVMAPDIMTVLYSEAYVESARPFRIYLLMLPIRVAHYGVIFLSLGRSSIILWRSVVALSLNFALNIVLVRRFGYMGATVATVLVIYLWSMPFNLYWIRRLTGWTLPRMFPYRDLLAIMGISLIAGLPVAWMLTRVDASALIRTAAGGAIYGGILVLLLWHMNYINPTQILKKIRPRRTP